jgi:putative endonuclease
MAKDEPATKGKPRPPADPERRVAFRFGLSAESRAAALLIAKGYRILFRPQPCMHSFAGLRGPS